MQESAARILRPLPRRRLDRHPRRSGVELLSRPAGTPDPSFFVMLARGMRWYGMGLKLLGRLGADRLRRRASPAGDAIHLRRFFEDVGGSAIKIGQQLSLRSDMLPWSLCAELARLTDRVPPFPIEQAIARIERAIGGPLESVFSALDPEPVGAASIACVYKARLHDGREVAVKVQRPGVAEGFRADIASFELMTRMAELFTFVPPGFFSFLREELRMLFTEELDFRLEARYQRLFLRLVKEDKLDWVTAPEVLGEYSTEDVLVSSFAEGIHCAELVAAVEGGDTAALARFRSMGIDPDRVAKNIGHLSFWGRYEKQFFHGDPHPANIFIQKNSRLCMLDFGACAMLSRRRAALDNRLVRQILDDDVTGLSHTILATLQPLPNIDVEQLRRALERSFWGYQHQLRDPDSHWAERTSAGLWVHLVDVTRAFQLPVTSDTLRVLRATLLYDTLIFRLNPKADFFEAEEFIEAGQEREARRIERRLRRRGSLRRPALQSSVAEAVARMRGLSGQLDRLQAGAAPTFQRLVGLVALSARHATALGLGLLLVVVVLELSGVGLEVLGSPAGILCILTVLSLAGLRLRYRLLEPLSRGRSRRSA